MIKAIRVRDNENFEGMLEAAAKAGFKHIDIGFTTVSMGSDSWEKNAENMVRLMKERGLECVQTHLPCYDPYLSSEIRDAETETAIIRAITASRILGAEWCVYHPRSAVNFDYDKQRAFDDNRQDLEKYLNQAKIDNVGIAVENMALFPGPIWYGTDYHDVIDLVDYFNDQQMKVCWDFGHIKTAGCDHVEALKEMGDRIKCTHIHDNKGNADSHLAPFLGTIEWEKVMKQLKTNGYTGALALEPHYSFVPYQDKALAESFCKFCYFCLKTLESFMK